MIDHAHAIIRLVLHARSLARSRSQFILCVLLTSCSLAAIIIPHVARTRSIDHVRTANHWTLYFARRRLLLVRIVVHPRVGCSRSIDHACAHNSSHYSSFHSSSCSSSLSHHSHSFPRVALLAQQYSITIQRVALARSSCAHNHSFIHHRLLFVLLARRSFAQIRGRSFA